MILIDLRLKAGDLTPLLDKLFSLAGQKLASLERNWKPEQGSPVFTVKGRYTSRGWTEWTRGFLFGMGILHYDATGTRASLDFGRDSTIAYMAPHLTHTGVHDHGFNNVSTYGNLLRLMGEGRLDRELWEERFYSLALKVSSAVQAARWTDLPDKLGYIFSFNGPHSLFIDTMRTLRILALGHNLGHTLMGEQDRPISLLERLLRHGAAASRFNVFHGEGRDSWDVPGRTAHEAVFNIRSGSFRCPSSQQGYSPFTTWTRGLAWAVTGYSEQLEYLIELPEQDFNGLEAGGVSGKEAFLEIFQDTACKVSEYYIQNTPPDGIPYWDTGAPGLSEIPDHLERPADPLTTGEPVDSSAAAIAAQGFIRLGVYLKKCGQPDKGKRYFQTGLSIARTLFDEPYISTNSDHQGLILHSIYHHPNGWDHVPEGRKAPSGESSMWGDYHALELAVLIQRLARGEYFRFFDI
jgi:hypothetical protein